MVKVKGTAFDEPEASVPPPSNSMLNPSRQPTSPHDPPLFEVAVNPDEPRSESPSDHASRLNVTFTVVRAAGADVVAGARVVFVVC
jgi:hypothetical protein